ncbi:putative nuclease HARBI1 [Pomacea canaliculata]|uniref:putative nuclease HARBI1 n=1 Tax=Pomacea canaliculata TaxID=400727 RepID=UPI000D736797|nr:putative nuclease HARBI1 [Pomacea canaliculata]
MEFVNRRGYHSINCQLICDANLVITHCVINWPGSVHDSRILRESSIWQLFERAARPVPGMLLGDSGYPLREWLMTPFLDSNTRAKERYNTAHRTTRSTIERANGVLKKRWHCQNLGMILHLHAKSPSPVLFCIMLQQLLDCHIQILIQTMMNQILQILSWMMEIMSKMVCSRVV